MDDDYYSIDSILAENQVEYRYRNWLVMGETKACDAEDPMQIQTRYSRHGPPGGRLGTRCTCPLFHSRVVRLEAMFLRSNEIAKCRFRCGWLTF